MDNHSMYKKIEHYVKGLFENKADPSLVFHNLKHTQTVVARAKEIAGHYRLSEKDMLIVFAAAWFHDTGYLFTDAAAHEDKSVQIMKDFMAVNSTDNELTGTIEQCILATKMPRDPANILQHIICDADTYHFGTKDFKITDKLTKQELRLRNGELERAYNVESF
jgi:HD superfamily phosphodiesterase